MADATTATTPKIEELRARLKADPKSRHFYPLAEELRKLHHLEEAEGILREGLQNHQTYLSAWISLGRVLRERGRDHEAVEVLKRALALDGGNVVAAKLLAQAYLGVGDKVEAIKKFKLVYAMMPADPEVEAEIDRLDRELNPEAFAAPAAASTGVLMEPVPFAADENAAADSAVEPVAMLDEASRFDLTDSHPFRVDAEPLSATLDTSLSNLLEPSLVGDAASFALAQDREPSASAEGGMADGGTTEEGLVAPFAEDEASPFGEEPLAASNGSLSLVEASDDDLAEEPAAAGPVAIPATLTMAQLFERQGHEEQAAALYRQILEEHPENEEARSALARATAAPAVSETQERVKRLEAWRARVARS